MARHEFDKSSKWLVQRHGKGILFLGGARDVRGCRALQAELVQPRQLPDGLLEVLFQGRKKQDYVLVEVATYPEKRLLEQVLDDLMLTYQQLRVLPERGRSTIMDGAAAVVDRADAVARQGTIADRQCPIIENGAAGAALEGPMLLQTQQTQYLNPGLDRSIDPVTAYKAGRSLTPAPPGSV